jgi:alanyl-tRNA synthetase
MSPTNLLYYTDSTRTEFVADVVGVEPAGDHQAVCLDRTAFYPTSGGQPHDTGRLASARVLDVIARDDGSVWHIVEAASAPPLGQVIQGHVDWARRFDHMQQHTGQHILSAELARLANAQTVGFHLGSDKVSIDLDRSLTPEELVEAESSANQVVWDNLPVTVRFESADETAKLELRKPSARTGRIRLVEIRGCDLSACGGTHVGYTGSVGIIVSCSTERYKSGTRLGFVCGDRALRHFRQQRGQIDSCVGLLSVTPDEIAAEVERNQSEKLDQRHRIRTLQARLVSLDASQLVASSQPKGRATVVVSRLSAHDSRSLKAVALDIVQRPGHVAVLTSDAKPLGIVVARASNVSLDASALIRSVIDRWGGRGGGSAGFAQAGGLEVEPEKLLKMLDELLDLGLSG